MKKLSFIALFLLSVFAFSAHAQDAEFYSSRLDSFANDLKRSTVDLVDRTSEEMRRGSSSTRAAIEEAFLAHQLDASVGLFQQMIGDRRRGVELRDAAAIITELARRAPGYGSNSYLWRSVQDSINKINRELGSAGGGNTGGGNPDNRPVTGRVYWRGMIDNQVQLVIRDREIEQRVLSGQSYPQGTYNFTSALPTRRVAVDVIKNKGRGNVRVVQQPSKENDFTAIVEIIDSDGGAREYQLDIYWR